MARIAGSLRRLFRIMARYRLSLLFLVLSDWLRGSREIATECLKHGMPCQHMRRSSFLSMAALFLLLHKIVSDFDTCSSVHVSTRMQSFVRLCYTHFHHVFRDLQTTFLARISLTNASKSDVLVRQCHSAQESFRAGLHVHLQPQP